MSWMSSPRFIERALLGYVLMVIVVLTLSPFHFALPTRFNISLLGDLHDTPANMLLFLPVGFLHRLTLPRHHPRPARQALLIGALASLVLELTQSFLPARATSLGDLVGNASGAAAGSMLCSAAIRRLYRMLPHVLTLEHPLVNVVYLGLPLMWLTGVGISHSPERVWLLAPLGALTALTLSGLWKYHFLPAATMPRPVVALMILVWFMFGAITGVRTAPQVVAQCASGIFAVTLIRLYVGRNVLVPERRFERRMLTMLWPCYAVYLAMLVMWPHLGPFEPFDLAVGLYSRWYFNRDVATRVAEQLCALTLLGYLLAESFGRSGVDRRWRDVRNVVLGAVVAAGMEVGHGFLPGDRASVARWILGVAGVGFGVTLYSARLNVLRILRGVDSTSPTV